MATIAEDIFRRGIQNGIKEVAPVEKQEAPESKGFWGDVVSAVKGIGNTVSDIYTGIESFVTKPSLYGTIDSFLPFVKEDNGFGSNIAKSNVNFVGRNSTNEYEALAELKKQGAVEDEQKALITLKRYYNKKDNWESKYFQNNEKESNKEAVDSYQKELEAKNKSLLDMAQRNIFSNAQKNIGDFAALRATQENRDNLNYLSQNSIANLLSIKEKEEFLRSQGEDTSEVEEIRKKAERVYELGTKKQVQLSEMMSKYEGRASDVQKKVAEDVRKMGYKDINDFITRDFKTEFQDESDASMADYLLNLNNKANWQRQKNREKSGVWDYLKLGYWAGDTAVEGLTLKYLNPTYGSVVAGITGTGEGDFAEGDVSTLGGVSWTRDGKGQTYDKYMNKLMGAVPEFASFLTVAGAEAGSAAAAGALAGSAFGGVGAIPGAIIGGSLGFLKNFKKGAKILDKVADALDFGKVTLKGGTYTHRMAKALMGDTEGAKKFARLLDNATYTIKKRVPEEVITGYVGNAFDPDKGSDVQEHFGMLDVAFGLAGGITRQLTRIKRLNDVFDTPEAAEAFRSKFIEMSGNPYISKAELEAFNQGYKKVLGATEKFVAAAKSGQVEGYNDVGLMRLTPDQWNKETKKAYAKSYVRDLFIKRGDQLTPPDIQIIQGIQRLVEDKNLNVADLFKITRNYPGGLNIVGFNSKVKVAADKAIETPQFKYGKTVDEVFKGIQDWNPERVITRADAEIIKANIEKTGMYKNLFPQGIRWNTNYFKEIDEGIVLTDAGYKYLGIVDNRSDVAKLIENDSTLSVTAALRKSAERTGDVVPEDFLQTLERTNVIEKLISLNCK